MVGSDSSVDSKSAAGSEPESVMGYDSISLAGFVLGTLVGFESMCSATEEWFQPSILQSAKENIQHYVRSLCSVYTLHEGNPCNIL